MKDKNQETRLDFSSQFNPKLLCHLQHPNVNIAVTNRCCDFYIDKTHDPSVSSLFFARNSDSHLRGFSGSCVARYFIPSSKCGVTFWFKYVRTGLPLGFATEGGAI